MRAISIHTTLDMKLTRLDKILFVADKISKLDDMVVERMLRENFDVLFAKIVDKTYRELKLERKFLSPEQIKIYEK